MEAIAAVVVILGVMAAIALYSVTTILLNGWVLTKLWMWFVVPAFGAVPLRIPVAIGLACILHLAINRHSPPSGQTTKDKSKIVSGLLMPITGSLFTLLIGWIVRHWM